MPSHKPDEKLLEATHAAFRQVRGSAITSDGMASWLRAGPSPAGTIDPSVYSGTCGIAWALAEYAVWAGETWAADLSVQAIRHSLRHWQDIPSEQRLGFYSGWSGLVFAAVHVSRLLNETSTLPALPQLLAALRNQPPSHEFDLVSGAAGAVLSGSLLAAALGEEALDIAYGAARRLRQQPKARAPGGGFAWRPPRQHRDLPLTGVAHGASGAAWSLLELWALRREEEWLRDLAEQAFAYEGRLYDEAEENWPDLRYYQTWRATRILRPSYQAAWCHGAGGIALARLRAYEITADPAYLRMAVVAGRTLLKAADEALRDSSPLLNLCHGGPGNAELLAMLMTRTDFDAAAHLARSAASSAEALLSLRREKVLPELDTGLMLGTSGVGLSLSRACGGSPLTPLFPLGDARRNVVLPSRSPSLERTPQSSRAQIGASVRATNLP